MLPVLQIAICLAGFVVSCLVLYQGSVRNRLWMRIAGTCLLFFSTLALGSILTGHSIFEWRPYLPGRTINLAG